MAFAPVASIVIAPLASISTPPAVAFTFTASAPVPADFNIRLESTSPVTSIVRSSSAPSAV